VVTVVENLYFLSTDDAISRLRIDASYLDHSSLPEVAGQANAHEPHYWVRHLARGARHAVQDCLVAAGVLRRDWSMEWTCR
jgi:hypothetical protein